MNARLLFLGLPLTLVGCSTHNHFGLRDTLSRLPNGDEIICLSDLDQMPDRTYADTSIQWRRVSPTESVVQIEGQGQVRVKDIGKVLTVQGEPYIHAGRTVTYKSDHHPMTPEEIERSQRWQEMFAHAETRVSPDGNRVWLIYKGQTFASFDYDRALAIFGTANQPAWAISAADR